MRERIFFVFCTVVFCTQVFAKDFKVNSTTSNDQSDAAIAMDSAGNFVIVWSSYLADGNSGGILGQRYNFNCQPVGSEFQINNLVAGNQIEPAVAMAGNGKFIVAWQSGKGNEDIYARRFNADGTAISGQFMVNTTTKSRQMLPAIATAADGRFVIAWQSEYFGGYPSEGWDIKFQHYNSGGSPDGNETKVNLLFNSQNCDVAMDDYGNFAVAWYENDQQHPHRLTMIRYFDSAGTPLLNQPIPFAINTTPFDTVTHPAIGCTANGNYVITWEAHQEANVSHNIYARWYNYKGDDLSSELVVNTWKTGERQNPEVAINDQRDFVIFWGHEEVPDSNERDIHAQKFNEWAVPVGDEFTVNSYIADDQKYPAAVLKENGEFVAAWQSRGQDGSGYGIFAAAGQEVRFADFTGDLFVNFKDYRFLANEWLKTGNSLSCDLVDDNKINYLDLDAFCESWLDWEYGSASTDLNNDKKTNLKDFAILANKWLCQGPNVGDIDSDGTIDLVDLKILFSRWLSN